MDSCLTVLFESVFARVMFGSKILCIDRVAIILHPKIRAFYF